MKALGSDVLFYAVMLLGGSVYLAIRLPTHAVEYQGLTVALAASAAVAGVLLLVRFRWSPEFYLAFTLFFLALAIMRFAADGLNGNRLGMLTAGLVSLFGYPVLRGEVRGRAAVVDEQDGGRGQG